MNYKMNNLLKWMLIICFTIYNPVNNLYAQEVWEELIEQLASEDEDGSYQWENKFEVLSELRENPININTATKEQLECFPFLSDQMIENILYYLYKYGPMLTQNELGMVEDMDRLTIRCLLPFIYFGNVEKKENGLILKRILKYGKQELSTRMDIPLYTKAGYKDYSAEVLKKNPNKQYLGYKYYHNLRYSFHYRNQIYVGFVAENDAGEPFFSSENNKGYDFYSPYLFIHNVGRIRALAIGNYRLSYGYGLVMNTDFSMGKTADRKSVV